MNINPCGRMEQYCVILILGLSILTTWSCSGDSGAGSEDDKDYPHEEIQIPDSVKSACDVKLLQKSKMPLMAEVNYTLHTKIYDSTGELWGWIQEPCGSAPCDFEAPIDSSFWEPGRHYILRETRMDSTIISQSWTCVYYSGE